jgi:surface protein
VNSYIGYRVEYDNGDVELRYGRILDYDKKRRKELKSITGCFDYFIDETELFRDCEKLIEVHSSVVVRVTNMRWMFCDSKFNGDISEWNVSNVTNMSLMFKGSDFDGDISGWDVSSVIDMCAMFRDSDFDGDISGWDVSSVTDMSAMFRDSDCVIPDWYRE